MNYNYSTKGKAGVELFSINRAHVSSTYVACKRDLKVKLASGVQGGLLRSRACIRFLSGSLKFKFD